MQESALKIQQHYRARQKRKSKKKVAEKKKNVKEYDRIQEKKQEIGDEFLNPDKEMQ